jgi:hypothetical protein
MNDYAEHLLEMRKMLKELEELLTERHWAESVLMAAPMTAQLRLLMHTVRIQAEQNGERL